MLSSISWQHYLAAVVILSGSYYGYIVLRYYQAEIANLFNRKRTSSNLISGVSAAPFTVMGEAKLDNGVSLSETQDMLFSKPMPDEQDTCTTVSTGQTVAEPQISPSQELVIEAGNLIEAFKDMDNKTEFLNLLKILIDSYKRYQDDIDLSVALHRVVELAKEKLQFPIALTDFQNASA